MMKNKMFKPLYLDLYAKGEFDDRIAQAYEIIKDCRLCPRNCRVNRLEDGVGVCKTGRWPVVSSYGPHFGEEGPLVGTGGSGTIFFTHCNLLCIFCQNHEISHHGEGEPLAPEGLAEIMVRLQNRGCHNVNFVTPTHVVPMILAALPLAIERGLHIPLVYNSSGYDKIKALKLLKGMIDIYMPDFKFWDRQAAAKYMNAPDYPYRAKAALKEMHHQVGDLVVDEHGIAQRGLIVRHLVMPYDLAGTDYIMKFILEEISPLTYVNTMPQYRPCGEAYRFPELSRAVTVEEYENALEAAHKAGLMRLDRRERGFLQRWI
jgi:putative pyruvate formate lyase activating enzyme